MSKQEIIGILEDSPLYLDTPVQERQRLIRELIFMYPYLFGLREGQC